MSIPPDVLAAEKALTDLFAVRPDVVVRHTFRDPTRPHDPISMMMELGADEYRVMVNINEGFVMVAPHGRFGFTLSDWHPDLQKGLGGHLRVDWPSGAITEAQPGWLAQMADRLVPVVDLAQAAVVADRPEVGR